MNGEFESKKEEEPLSVKEQPLLVSPPLDEVTELSDKSKGKVYEPVKVDRRTSRS